MNELPIEMDVPSKTCQCEFKKTVEHLANREDWAIPGSEQGYQVYQCNECGDYWGCRYQWDAGTGSDNRWHRFGQSPNFKRHY